MVQEKELLELFKDLDELEDIARSLVLGGRRLVRHKNDAAEAVFRDLKEDLKVNERFKAYEWSKASYRAAGQKDDPHVFTIWKKPPPLN